MTDIPSIAPTDLRALEWTKLVAKRSIFAFFSVSLLILVSAFFINTSLIAQKQMLAVASITHDQRLLVNEISERIIFLLNNASKGASNRFIKTVQTDIDGKVALLNKNQKNLQSNFKNTSFMRYWPFSLFYTHGKSRLIKEIDQNIMTMASKIEKLVKADPDAVRTGFNFWSPDYLKLVKNGEHSLKISKLNEMVRESAIKQSKILSTLHFYLLFVVFSGMWLIWFFALRPLSKRLETVFSMLMSNQKKLEYQASHDSLTGIYNRQSFSMHMKEISQHGRHPNAAVMAIDLDDFKIINDTAGHMAGDTVLEHVATQMMKNKLEGEKHFRIGGDEFIIVIENLDNWDRLQARAGEICNACSTPITINGRIIDPKISMGIAYQNGQFNSLNELLSASDLALYHVKSLGGNAFSEYSQVEKRSISRLLNMEKELGNAIKEKEFIVYYQPIIRSVDDKVVGLEVLSRWNHSAQGVLLPSNWLSAAKRLGLLTDISTNALSQIEIDIQKWHSLDIHPVQVSINATESLLTSGDMLKQLSASQSTISKDKKFTIGVEIPESIILDRNYDKIIDQLVAMREQGFKVLLDDFGTGYATLSHLATLPFDTVKVDKQFTRNLTIKPENRIIIKTLISMANDLDKELICEGVEDYQTLHDLTDMGCKYIQGHYYAKALPFKETTQLLKKQYIDEEVTA